MIRLLRVMGRGRSSPFSTSGRVLYRRLFSYILPNWHAFAISTVALIVVAATETAFAALVKPLLDETFVDRNAAVIQATPFVLILIFLVSGIATYISAFWMAWVARQIIKILRRQMFEQLLCLPVAFFDQNSPGTLISKLIYDVEQVAQATTDVITIIVRDTFIVFGLLAWMFYLDWKLALILTIGTPVIARFIIGFNRRFRRYSSRIQTSMGEVTHIATEAIEGQRMVKTFSGSEYERGRFDEANERNRKLSMKLLSISAASVPVVQLVAAISAAGVIFFAIHNAELSVGSFVSFVAAMMMLLAPMKRLTRVSASLQKGIAAADSIFHFIDTPAEIDSGRRKIKRSDGTVTYENVCFAYDGGARTGNVLHAISFLVEPGESIAFVGRSGSGKSTLVSLLPRFYDVSTGAIRIDGVDIRDFSLASLREQIALVTQDITLFNDTIANNIAYGRLEGAHRDQIEAVAIAAHAMEFISNFPDGLDTRVGVNGIMLSGGQRQRLALARALLKDAPILILDEATSALDTASELHIQAALDMVMKNRTTLVISHRLSTIKKSDRIIVVEQGRIIESGSHAKLLAAEGHYAALYHMQFRDD